MPCSNKKDDKHYKLALAQFVQWLDRLRDYRLRDYRVLDPACGSGNFLFLGLKTLKDIEHQSHLEAAALGLDREADLVTCPHNMLGIELNEYAAELARVTHGFEFKTNPVLEPLDHIECRDALISWASGSPQGGDAQAGQRPPAHTLRFLKSSPASAPPALADLPTVRAEPVEAVWPKASVVIGNPPFLGDKKKRGELGGEYTETLRTTYKGRVPGGADLVCYWFEKARKAIEINGLGAAGLVATNSIRGGKNRAVLDAIAKTTRIYEAWSDEGWVNEGAAVRVSLIAFGHADQGAVLDGQLVPLIHADLSAASVTAGALDLTTANQLSANKGSCFIGGMKKGAFDISGELARRGFNAPNPNSKSNMEVVKPWFNGLDITRRPADNWIVDFGMDSSVNEASLFEAPFAHVAAFVRPQRDAVRNDLEKARWWLHARTVPDLRSAVHGLPRMIATARNGKYRLFVKLHANVIADGQLVVVARADDSTLGILHSRFHELWFLRMCTWLGVGNDPRYTPTTCFETFPFPEGLTPADTAHQQTETIEGGAVIPSGLAGGISAANVPPAQSIPAPAAMKTIANRMTLRIHAEAIARAAQRLNDLREARLNPPKWTERAPEVVPLGMTTSPYPDRILPKLGHEKDLAERTLTKLYNLRPAWLDTVHKELDKAVATAYEWADYTLSMADEEILKRLLALNLAQSSKQ